MMWRPRLPSPFGATFLGVPTAFQLILHDLGFAPVQSDGEILVACCLEWVKKDVKTLQAPYQNWVAVLRSC